MPSVDLSINGRTYTMACDKGEEERLQQLAAMVDERARQLGSAASEAQRLLMVSLVLADELDLAKRDRPQASTAAGNGDEEHELLVAAVEHLTERIDHIAASLSQT
jgi:cell division protein ZapA